MQPYEPTPDEVKSLMPQRLEGQPFAEDSVPSHAQVVEIISDVAGEVAATLSFTIPEAHYGLARYCVKVGAAAEIERSFFPEQHAEADTATYARYVRRYRELLDALGNVAGGNRSKVIKSVVVPTRTRDAYPPELLL